MNSLVCLRWIKRTAFQSSIFALIILAPGFASALEPVDITIEPAGASAELAPHFLGLSYEASMLLTNGVGHYYFDTNDAALINTFKTLGIKSLRVGANAVDDERIPVPQEKDIDALFNFARAAGVKVIYSFRLKNGNPDESARLAAYIAAHDADALDCFAIGNEPGFYLKTFPEFIAQWRPQYDAILKAVPNALFDGPSSAGKNNYVLDLTETVYGAGHMAMLSDHYYFLGSGRAAEKDPAASRARFLSNRLHADYERDYDQVGAVLAAQNVPYRIDEMNSCYNGGAKDSSDTYASTLWSLDCTHWWTAHHILGMNYHTGESVGRDGKFGPPNYAAFLHETDGAGFIMRPEAYGLLAFSQGMHGQSLKVRMQADSMFNFNAYACQDKDGSIYVTLINKSTGAQARAASATLQLPSGTGQGTWQRMDLAQKDQDVAAKTGVTLGGSAIDANGNWAGRWTPFNAANSGPVNVEVAPVSAAILHFMPAK